MSLVNREDSLSIVNREKIDRICLQFEDEWLNGRRPAIEPYLRQIHPAARPVLLGELLLLELDYRRSLKEEPSVADYVPRFPRCGEVIQFTFGEALKRPVPVRFVPGSRIGRYEVRRILGTGAFAIVFLAWDVQLEREVAVKVPHRFLLSDKSARQRFLDEARTIARLRHPRIVALYDVDELKDGTIYLVMQYVAGDSLRDVLRGGRLSPDEACQIAAKVADAMDVAHRAGVFHRDLKPGNILLDEQGEPHVCDFGLALQVENQRERQGECAGTWSYMAPEQIRGEAHQLDGRADIWALGVICYELLTGRLPFEGRNRQELSDEILHRDPRPPRQFDARISRRQESVCLRCLAKQPAQRYATAGDVADGLRVRDESRPLRRVLLLAAALVLLLSLTCIISVVWVRSLADPHAAPLPTHGTIDLLVWGAHEADRQGVRVVDELALPLRTGDRLRVNVQLNQPAFIYVLWLDTHGTVLPIYPWPAGNWEPRSANERPRMCVSLPQQHDAGWMMQATEDGMETLLLLVRSSRLPREVDLPSLLSHIAHRSLAIRSHAVSFQDGQPLAVAMHDQAPIGSPRRAGQRCANRRPAAPDATRRGRDAPATLPTDPCRQFSSFKRLKWNNRKSPHLPPVNQPKSHVIRLFLELAPAP